MRRSSMSAWKRRRWIHETIRNSSPVINMLLVLLVLPVPHWPHVTITITVITSTSPQLLRLRLKFGPWLLSSETTGAAGLTVLFWLGRRRQGSVTPDRTELFWASTLLMRTNRCSHICLWIRFKERRGSASFTRIPFLFLWQRCRRPARVNRHRPRYYSAPLG